MIVDQLFTKKIDESLADQIMQSARAAGLNPRLAGTPEQERERSQQILAQRAQERDQQARQAAMDDARNLMALKTEYKQMKDRYESLGGSNWQYADREQNLTDREREARGMEPALNRLAARIHAAEKVITKESRQRQKINEAQLMEDPVYRNFKRVGRYIAEAKLSQAQILQIFADAEAGMTDKATGANRTFLGRGKDATVDFAKDVAGAVNGVLNSIQNSVPVSAVDVAYDQATDALANVAGGQKGAVMTAIKKYRNLVKQYPKTAGFAKAALVAIAGLATGGAGLPAIAGLTYALDSAIKGDKLSSVLGKGAGAAALAAAGQAVYGGATQPSSGGPADTSAFTNVNQMGDYTGDYTNMPDPGSPDSIAPLVAPTPDLATYTVQPGDNLSKIAARFDTSVGELRGLNPQLAAASGATGGQSMNVDVIFPGQQITLPPGTPGTDVYAGGVGTSADTMADIARGNVPDSPISQAMATKGQAAANTSNAGQGVPDRPSAASDFGTGGNAPIDYTSPGPESTDSMGQKLEYGIPVNDKGSFVPPNPNLPPQELAAQQAAYDAWKSDFMRRFPNASPGPDGSMLSFKPGLAPMQILQKPTLPAAVQESVKIKKLPFNKLVDEKSTVMNWALSESVGRRGKSVTLSTVGTYTVFENIERYRQAIMELKGVPVSTRPEYYRPDMMAVPVKADKKPGLIGRGLNWLDKKAGQVGGALSNFGHQFTTNVTKEKLKMNWHQAGKPSDSDQLAAWLVKQGVPQAVVTSVYGKMGIPYTAPVEPASQSDAQAIAPSTTGTAQRLMPFNNINPKTGKRWTVDDLAAERNPQVAAPKADALAPAHPATSATPTMFPGEDPQGPGYVGRREVARRQAARAAQPDTSLAKTPSYAGPSGYGKTTMTAKPMTGVPGMKPTVPTAPAATKVTTGGPTQAEREKYDQLVAKALAKPVAEMLEIVETKEDIQRIKKFVDETFVKYGAVNKSAFELRNKIIEDVTQVGAQRRREFARQS